HNLIFQSYLRIGGGDTYSNSDTHQQEKCTKELVPLLAQTMFDLSKPTIFNFIFCAFHNFAYALTNLL
ncbi:hypothetical protein KKB40_05900, partial [Patescibacteria group bacterium]|nr:hypothetical protein [Patescibacteria group bacterium]